MRVNLLPSNSLQIFLIIREVPVCLDSLLVFCIHFIIGYSLLDIGYSNSIEEKATFRKKSDSDVFFML